MNDHYKSSNVGSGGSTRGHFSTNSGSGRYHYSNSAHDKRQSSTATTKGKTEWRKTAIRICGDWSEQLSSKNKIYYYNCTTEVSQWQKPEDWTLQDVPKQELIEQYHRRERSHDKESHSVKRAYPTNNSGSNHQYSTSDMQYSGRSSTSFNAGAPLHKVSSQQRPPPNVSSSHRPSSGGVSPKRLRYDSSGSVDIGSNQYSSNNHNYNQHPSGARVPPKTAPHSASSTANSTSANYNQHSSGAMISSNAVVSTSSRTREGGGSYRASSGNHLPHLHNPNSLGSMLAARANSQQKNNTPSSSSNAHLPVTSNPHLEDMDISPGSSPLSGDSCSPQPQPTNVNPQYRKHSPLNSKQPGPLHRVQTSHHTTNTSSSGNISLSSSTTRHQAASSSLPVRQLIDCLSRTQSTNSGSVNSSSTSRQQTSNISSTNPSVAYSSTSSLINNVAQQLLYSRQMSSSATTSSASQQSHVNYSRSLSSTQTSQSGSGSGINNNNAIITSLINSLSNNNSQSQQKNPVLINSKPDSAPQSHSSTTNRHLEDLVTRLESQLSRDHQQHSQSLHINTNVADSGSGLSAQSTVSPVSVHPRHQQHSSQLPTRPSPLLDKRAVGPLQSPMSRSGPGPNEQNPELIRLLTDILKNPSILQQLGKENNSYKSIITLLQKYLEDLKNRHPNSTSPSVSAAIQKTGVSPSLINKIPHSNGCHLGVNSGDAIDSHSTTKPHSFPPTLSTECGPVSQSGLSRGSSNESTNSSCPALPTSNSPHHQNSGHQTPTASVLDNVGIMQYLDSMPLSRFKDHIAEKLEQEAQVEAQKFDKLQTVLYGELSGELKKLRALIRIGEAKTAVQQKKKDMLEELMESIESRKTFPPSFSSTFKATT